MSASKYPTHEGRQKLGPLGMRPPVPRPEGHLVLVQEKVLAEIGHELGNFFHKLYYWSDYLRDKPVRKTADSTAVQMLARTIKNLEEFLKASLEYFYPLQLSFTRMGVGDLMEGLLHQLRAQLGETPLRVAGDGDWQGTAVMVDPGRLSQVFEIAVRQLVERTGPGSVVSLAVTRSTRRDCSGLEVEFQVANPNEASSLFQTAAAGVAWAIAEKVVALHGGELADGARGGESQVVIFLPLYAS